MKEILINDCAYPQYCVAVMRELECVDEVLVSEKGKHYIREGQHRVAYMQK